MNQPSIKEKIYEKMSKKKLLSLTISKIEIKFGKGFSPWSNDSVIRGPLITKYKFSFLKTKYDLKSGLLRFIDFAKGNLN